ncbi:MAG: fused MFS/spermidine synthase, partial [Kiritimatiellia bacterium]
MKRKSIIPLACLLLSGFACLVFQLLWMRQLGLIFGNTAYAAAMTLALFFAGLALGSWFWGEKSAKMRNPMLAFAGLEIGIAVTALLDFGMAALFQTIYPHVYQQFTAPALRFAAKGLLAACLILPPAFFMGGTTPMIGQALIRHRNTFGRRGAWLYAINTFGAALGALATGFFLVRLLGVTWTCILAIGITLIAAAAAYFVSREQEHAPLSPPPGFAEPPQPRTSYTLLPVYAIAFISGFGFLAMEVLWTQLLAQIHTNSVYSFSTVLVIVLVSLGLGAGAAARLSRWISNPMRTLAALLILGGLALMASPFLFMATTDGFKMLDVSGTFGHFIIALFGKGILVIGLPAFILATIFPFLMKTAESYAQQPGATLGRLTAIDTAGSIAGALFCGFVFLAHFGIWRTMQLIAALYLVVGLMLPIGRSKSTIALRAGGTLGIVLLFSVMSPVDLRVTGWNPGRSFDNVLDIWETNHGTVSVSLDEHSGYVIKMNSNYWLGSTGAALDQHFQGRIPLLVYPQTRSIFFLGMGTGISAGAALDPRFKAISRVVACELSPEVVTAAEKYMTGRIPLPGQPPIDYTSGLFTDPRVEIVVEDGRQYLMASGETFDIVNADLFLPYRRGAGSLYSREHFRNVRNSLTPDGVFVQWLPMFQLTEFEFGVIARTMLEVFDQVTAWRNNFTPGREALALIGHMNNNPLPP